MKRKELVFPFLLHCCKYTENISWKNIFEDMAYGKAPYGSYIFKDTICCNDKGKKFSYKLNKNKDPKSLYTEIVSLIGEHLGIYSTSEIEEKKKLYENIEKSLGTNRDEWKRIRKKNIRDQIIEEYIIDNISLYNISIYKARKLLAIITLAFQFKILGNKEISYKDHNIVSIDGISFKEGNVVYSSKLSILIATRVFPSFS